MNLLPNFLAFFATVADKVMHGHAGAGKPALVAEFLQPAGIEQGEQRLWVSSRGTGGL